MLKKEQSPKPESPFRKFSKSYMRTPIRSLVFTMAIVTILTIPFVPMDDKYRGEFRAQQRQHQIKHSDILIMSSITVDKGSAAEVQRSDISVFKEPLQCFLRIIQSCRTHKGNIKILQSSNGGNITLTSSSRRLFSNLSVKKPIIQLLVSAAQGHLEAYSDFGLFLTSLAANLVLKSMNSNRNLKILSECYEEFLSICLQHLASETCQFKYHAMVSDLTFMQSFVKSILVSKPLCGLDVQKSSHVTHLILHMFLHGVSDKVSGHIADTIYVVTQPGYNVHNSKTMNGLLVQSPELSKFKIQTLKPIKTQITGNKDLCIKVALIAVSLSGDLEETSGINYEVSSDVSWYTAILEGLTEFCDSLVQSDVGLVLCQKVVHPQLKLHLRKSGVIVVDRIGSYPMTFISSITGCQLILSVGSSISDCCYGYITDLKHEIINKQSYLLLTQSDHPLCTLVLCHNQEESLNELKDVCMTCVDSLQQLLYVPYVLAGGGCWQTALATYLLDKVTSNVDKLSIKLDVPVSVIKSACKLFSDSLIETITDNRHNYTIDIRTGHVYLNHKHLETDDTTTCSCHLYSILNEENDIHDLIGNRLVPNLLDSKIVVEDVLRCRYVVLDGYQPAFNALQTAVLTASSILKIGQVVENM